MQRSGWRSIPESCPDDSFQRTNHKSRIFGRVVGLRGEIPEAGIAERECDAGFNRASTACAEKDDAAVLLFLRQPVGQQQFLSLLYGNAEKEQRTIRVHMQRVRFFMKRFLARSGTVSVDVYGYVERPPAASPAVWNFRGALRRSVRRLTAPLPLRMF